MVLKAIWMMQNTNFHITNVELLRAQIQKNYVYKTVDDMFNTLR